MADPKKPKEVPHDVLTKVRVSFGGAFSFEAEGRETTVVEAYQRALDAFLAVTPKESSRG